MWTKRATLAIVTHQSVDEHIHVAGLNIWLFHVSEVKCEVGLGSLTEEWTLNWQLDGVVVKHSSHDWLKDAIKDVVSNVVNRILNDNKGDLDDLMHEEGHKHIIVVEVRLPDVEAAVVELRRDVSLVSKMQVSLKVNIKILELKLNRAVGWVKKRVDGLLGHDVPFLDRWEVHLQVVLSVALQKVDVGVLDIELNIIVIDVGDIHMDGECIEKHANLVAEMVWKTNSKVSQLWGKVTKSVFEGVHCALFKSERNTWSIADCKLS